MHFVLEMLVLMVETENADMKRCTIKSYWLAFLKLFFICYYNFILSNSLAVEKTLVCLFSCKGYAV